ncbi:MAG: hypothetical protein HUU22_00160 [Phycisphaerae bacterium]|nr:hypothetical protein [Phycisphaerae bacterium]NUQ44426.1 hypothetical protein [Phycisphaerae bacterium]
MPRRLLKFLVLLVLAVTGCAPKENRIVVDALEDSARPRQFHERFDDAFFSFDGRDRWTIVLHSRRPAAADPAHDVEQILILKLFWRPIPGTTFADSTQTDALITYGLITAGACIAYEGAGFVYFSRSRDGTRLVGSIESSNLAPDRKLGEPADIFGRCRVTGRFVARRDFSKVAELVSRLNQRVGPPTPKREPPPAAEPR